MYYYSCQHRFNFACTLHFAHPSVLEHVTIRTNCCALILLSISRLQYNISPVPWENSNVGWCNGHCVTYMSVCTYDSSVHREPCFCMYMQQNNIYVIQHSLMINTTCTYTCMIIMISFFTSTDACKQLGPGPGVAEMINKQLKKPCTHAHACILNILSWRQSTSNTYAQLM